MLGWGASPVKACPHQDQEKSLNQSLQVPQSTELELKNLMNKICSISPLALLLGKSFTLAFEALGAE